MKEVAQSNCNSHQSEQDNSNEHEEQGCITHSTFAKDKPDEGAIQHSSSSDSDTYGIMGILNNIKIADMPPPMEGVLIEVKEEEKNLNPEEQKKRWLQNIEDRKTQQTTPENEFKIKKKTMDELEIEQLDKMRRN